MPDSPIRREFWRQGFVCVPGVFQEPECRSLAELVERVVDEQAAVLRSENPALLGTPGRHGGIPIGDSTLRATVEVGEDGSSSWELTRPTRWYPEYPRFRETALDSRIAAIASELLGGEALVYADQAFLKPPGKGGPRSLHQDNWYFGLTTSDVVLTAWIALDDADEENGALRYRPGTHRNGVVPHTNRDEQWTITGEHAGPAEEVIAAAKMGTVVFHHGATMHSSGPNVSQRQRRAYGVHYLRRGARFWRDSNAHLALGALLAAEGAAGGGGQGDDADVDAMTVEQDGRIQVSDTVRGMRDELSRDVGGPKL
jgi:phytanoyl-CoA hydroxylase